MVNRTSLIATILFVMMIQPSLFAAQTRVPASTQNDAAPAGFPQAEGTPTGTADSLRGVVGKAIRTVSNALDNDAKRAEASSARLTESATPANPITDVLVKQEQIHRANARAALARAEAETDPVMAAFHFREARLNADSARNVQRRIETSIAPSASALSENVNAPIDSNPNSNSSIRLESDDAFFQAAGIFLDQRGFMELDSQQRQQWLLDSQQRQRFSEDPIDYDPETQTLTTADGTIVDIGEFYSWIETVVPEMDGQLFEEVASTGGESSYRLNDGARNALASEQNLLAMEDVGGVALEVTLDLLSFLGVSDFRTLGPATVVEFPTLISLSHLLEQVRPYSNSAEEWATLPDRLRFPGGVSRIHGYVLEPETQDVFLVATAAAAQLNRIDIDSIILALRAVWRDGEIPSVSLDSVPGDSAGPQYSKVYEVPFDSVFAKIMLDADYAMKRILFGELQVGIPEFRNLNRERALTTEFGGANRYWLSPIPLARNDIHISGTGRTVLTNTGVRSQTEAEDEFGEYTGTTRPVAEQLADLFSQSYALLESSELPEPLGIYKRLHGLVDLVTVSQILRERQIGYFVLEEFADLPTRQLQGNEAVPAFYRGLSVDVAEVEDWVYSVVGGAVLNVGRTGIAWDRYQDSVTRRLEQGVDAFPRGASFTMPTDVTFAVPDLVAAEQVTTPDERLIEGEIAVTSENWQVADQVYTALVLEDPFWAEAWLGLAQSQAGLGRYADAARSLGNVVELAPTDTWLIFRATEFQFDVEEGLSNNDDYETWEEIKSTPLFRAASRHFSHMALKEALEGDLQRAKLRIVNALGLWFDNPDAHVANSMILDDPMEAIEELERALRWYADAAAADGSWEQYGRSAANAAALYVENSMAVLIDNLFYIETTSVPTEREVLENVEYGKQEMERLLNSLSIAKGMDPRMPSLWSTEAIVRATYASVVGTSEDIANPGSLEEARNVARYAVREFPDFADSHLALAYVALTQARGVAESIPNPALVDIVLEEVFEQVERSLELNPRSPRAYFVRALARLSQLRGIEAVKSFKFSRGYP